MRRILLIVFGMGFKTIYHFVRICKCSAAKNKDYQKGYEVIKQTCIDSIRTARVTVEIEGLENIPKEDGFIFYPNHQGLFDVLVFFASCPKAFAFVIKKEVSKVILLKQIIAATGSLVMDRNDVRQSVEIIKEVTRQVRDEKRNFLIFAEGTRSKNGNKLLDFKGGSFKAAINSRCPIVPCALIDSFKPFDEKGTHPVTIKLVYLQPIYYEEYKDMKGNEIAKEVKERIENAISERLDKEISL